MSLHNDIMNLKIEGNKSGLYKAGHRDARHAAAELALKYECALEEALSTLSAIRFNESEFLDYLALSGLQEIEKILSE